MAIPPTQSIRSESEMVSQLRPIMPFDLFMAAIEGNSDELIRRLGLQPEEPMQIDQVTIQASHSAPEQIKTEHQTVQSELQSATRFGDTVLHLLVTKGHNELALMVFRRDVSLLKSPNKKLETPLYCAAKVGNDNVIHNLIQIDPVTVKDALQQTNESGDTALHVAAKYDYIPISLALMKLDPNVSYMVNNNMFSALNVAIDRKYTKMVKTMLEQDHALAYTQFSTGMFPVHLAASTCNKELVVHLMEKYPECAKLLDTHGRNLFHVAAEEDRTESFLDIFKTYSVREMIARMNNAQDYEGNTPLHIAAMKGYRLTMCVIWLCKMYNVAETIKNKEGLTPFELSRRQVVETYRKDSMLIYSRIRAYERTNGEKFSQEWFDDVMVPSSLENKWERTQVIGLGSVLITTVTFAAAFTIPGGYNQDNGTPVLGRRYMFWAFILANALSFMQGFLSLFALLTNALPGTSIATFKFAIFCFLLAASSMVVAFGLGLYVTLAPVCLPIAIILLVITLFMGSPALLIILFRRERYIEMVTEFLNSKRNLVGAYIVPLLLIFSLAALVYL